MSHVIIWEFVVREGCEREFEQAYGPTGAWAALFGKSPQYIGTELLRDMGAPRHYVTIDRWISADAFGTFRKEHSTEYEKLDARYEAWTEKESKIGNVDGGAMIDHISLGVSDLAHSGIFYDAVLGTLGYVRVLTHERALGWGRPGARDEAFAILAAGDRAKAPDEGCHVAFSAPSREAVDSFHAVALKEGGSDEGGPGPRPKYGPGYYAAFVLDLDGHRLEAVCHET